jgi:hypothetical protein
VLGSSDTTDWQRLGEFRILGGELPPPSALGLDLDIPIQIRFVVGDLYLTDGRLATNLVASFGDVGHGSTLPQDSLTFVVHDRFDNPSQAISQAESLQMLGEDTAPCPDGLSSSLQSDSRIVASLVGDPVSCPNACTTAYNGKVELCHSSYGTCVVGVTVAYGLCNLTCWTIIGCLACAAAYYGALYICDDNESTCLAAAALDRNACIASCSSEVPYVPPSSPIVIDLDGQGGFRFTSLEDGVIFDLNGDGDLERTAWTAPGYQQAFLALDRNGNGAIDDGRELFGDVTPQRVSTAPNGYLALGLFDEAGLGGDADGLITQADTIYPVLQLWLDANHDGISQPDELTTLEEGGVQSIDLDYVTLNRQDQHGNLLRYRSLVTAANRVTHSVDVFFVHEALE